MNRHPAYRLLKDAGPTISVPEYAQIYGISKGLAYQLAAQNALTARVLRLGSRLRISTADVLRDLGLTDESAA